MLSKVGDFSLIPELKLIVVGSGSSTQSHDSGYLKLYEVTLNKTTQELEVKVHPQLKKESAAKVVEIRYDIEKKLLSCLNGDNKIEFFKVNVENQDHILKKMVRVEKRRALKRKRAEVDDSGDELPTEKKVDKASLKERFQAGDYDLSMHFSKKTVIDVEPS